MSCTIVYPDVRFSCRALVVAILWRLSRQSSRFVSRACKRSEGVLELGRPFDVYWGIAPRLPNLVGPPRLSRPRLSRCLASEGGTSMAFKSVSTNPPCSKGIVSKPTGAQSVVPWVSGGRAHRHRAVPGVWRLRAGEFGASGDRWWPQDRVFFGNNGPRGQPEGKVEGPWVCGHALRA